MYQKALLYELARAGFQLEEGKRLCVKYDGVIVGDFVADIVVNGALLIENKAVQNLVLAHEVQLVNYLTATGIDEGLLLNFGAVRLEFKKKFRQPRAASPS